MSNAMIERCADCGKVYRITGDYRAMLTNGLTRDSAWCRCVPGKPTQQHDGKLPAGSNLSADGEVHWAGNFIHIECGPYAVMLNRKQGRLLLDWLREELTKEQAQ